MTAESFFLNGSTIIAEIANIASQSNFILETSRILARTNFFSHGLIVDNMTQGTCNITYLGII